jgi:LuxR family maltose regulon positive regulatory protein
MAAPRNRAAARRIYAKLGAADRTAAVERGRELRLLSVGRT